ncbi:YfhO family protein [Streptomyces sp. Isolate_45]|uniref:YfhO family protein n=1 Tax=Streptomyces sp. Isolate_45 TaxID=2950111 RepID=UPI002481EABA|nr:YfhO family protein [Streptomyces sp. Isolate_45]MDA5283341.1 YfhO family protein [Streptomyces sp. Isolate_45]
MSHASLTPAPTDVAAGRRIPAPPPANRRAARAAPPIAALMAMVAYCAGLALHGTFPFGIVPRADNDLRHQYVPFHTYLWDLQHGTAQGDLLFNWQSGYGVGFLADFATYLANPFSWLTGLFPRDEVEFAVFLVSLLAIGLAAALMTVFLGRLRPGSPWLRAQLAVGYAVCGWNVAEGAIVPMWTWGLVALPMLALVTDWCLTGRRRVLGTFLIALCWSANFYTAAMATLAAAILLALRLTTADVDRRTRVRVLARAAGTTATGLLLAAPVILVCALANAQAQPTDRYVVGVGTAPLTYLAMFLPGSLASPTAPNVFVGVLVLLLVLALPFQSRVPVRERVAWALVIALTAVSFVVTPTAKLWQGFALPHGAPFREAFVLSGFLVMAAWVCLARMPRPRALLGGAALLALLVALTHDAQPVSDPALRGTLAGGVVFTGLLLLYARGLRRRARAVVVSLLAASVVATTAYSVYAVTTLEDPSLRGPSRPQTMTTAGLDAHEALTGLSRWPDFRAEAGPGLFVTNNDAMLLGGQGGSYYSSYVSRETASGLAGLGLGEAMGGRHLWPARDPVLHALFGVGATLDTDAPTGLRPRTMPAPPLVTVRPPGSDRPYGAPADSVWARRQAALGARVYTVPDLAPADPGVVRTAAGWPLTPADEPGRAHAQAQGRPGWANTFTARCAPGDRAFLYAPALRADVAVRDGVSQGFYGDPPVKLTPLEEVGRVSADGLLTFDVRTGQKGQVLPADAIGCLDAPALDAAVRRLRDTGATAVRVDGHSISADLPKGSTGTAVVATTAPPGWTCSADDGPARPPVSHQGLLGVPLGEGADRVACAYTPPGLTAGLMGSAAGALVVAGVLLAPLLRRLRSRSPRRPATGEPPRVPDDRVDARRR